MEIGDRDLMFLHVITKANHVYTDAFVKMIKQSFGDEHKILFLGSIEEASAFLSQQDNISYAPEIGKSLYKKIKAMALEVDYIIFHMYTYDNVMQGCMLLNPQMMKKSVWVEWGADLYSWKRSTEGHSFYQKIKDHLANIIFYWFRKKTRNIVAYKMDQPECIRQFGNHATLHLAGYPLGYTCETIDDCRPLPTSNSKIIRIMVGHSATKDDNHIEVLDNLYRNPLKDSIEIVLPLNYGDHEYAKAVIDHAQKLFPGRCNAILNRLDMPNYIRLLWSIDIAIFHSTRQIALGNIYMLMHMGKKICIPSGSIMYNFFVGEGVRIYDSNHLEANEAMQQLTEKEATIEKQYVFQYIDKTACIKRWEGIFQRLKDQKEN